MRLGRLLLVLGGEGSDLLLLHGLADGLAVHGALVVAPGASDLGPGGGTQVGGEVVLGLGAGGVDGVVVSEESGNQGLLLAALLGGESLNLADKSLAAVVVVHVGDGVEVGVDLVKSGSGLLGGLTTRNSATDSGTAVSALGWLAEVTEVLGGQAGNVGSDGLLDNTGTDDTDGDGDSAGRGQEGGQGARGEGDGSGAQAEEGEASNLGVGDGDGADQGGEECQDLGVHGESWKEIETFYAKENRIKFCFVSSSSYAQLRQKFTHVSFFFKRQKSIWVASID